MTGKLFKTILYNLIIKNTKLIIIVQTFFNLQKIQNLGTIQILYKGSKILNFLCKFFRCAF